MIWTIYPRKNGRHIGEEFEALKQAMREAHRFCLEIRKAAEEEEPVIPEEPEDVVPADPPSVEESERTGKYPVRILCRWARFMQTCMPGAFFCYDIGERMYILLRKLLLILTIAILLCSCVKPPVLTEDAFSPSPDPSLPMATKIETPIPQDEDATPAPVGADISLSLEERMAGSVLYTGIRPVCAQKSAG